MQTLDIIRDTGWATIWLNRPDKRNAMNDAMIDELMSAFEALATDSDVRGMTMRGRGGFFCAGGDLNAFQVYQSDEKTLAETAAFNRRIGTMLDAFNHLPMPTVVLVEGAAIAGGLGLMCCADVIATTPDAKFSLTETMIGIPPAQIAPFVVARVGLSTARRIMLTGARFDGTEAGRLGLADHVTHDLDGVEAQVRKGVLRCAPGANAATKALILGSTGLSRDAVLDRAADSFAACLRSEEGREGVASFLEKRKPNWSS
ncbi:enoyl-CoA hydratase-related protein [uncultured Algimonas sp.]|uniref:enoyl-CoA hydratase/isomerase family protein n=1 Tax=uncultured Algimonas sp. TaxID=1547920 RepID=UPI002618FB64|nr:enoyl-CoA hydratase-related protein [uncultured Algimonas sp.]